MNHCWLKSLLETVRGQVLWNVNKSRCLHVGHINNYIMYILISEENPDRNTLCKTEEAVQDTSSTLYIVHEYNLSDLFGSVKQLKTDRKCKY